MVDMYTRLVNRETAIAVIGLGHAGLPLALAFSKHVPVIGYDTNANIIERYRQGMDAIGDVGYQAIQSSNVEFTSDETKLENADFFIVAVPTPVRGGAPDLAYVREASRIIAKRMKIGAVVVYESTVYPGMTEELCIPILERESGFLCGEDFKVGCSPERSVWDDEADPADQAVKIVSGMDEETIDIVAAIYSLIIDAGVFRAPSIKVAESAKVIGHAQREINIAFMNEMSMMFHRMGMDAKAVLETAGMIGDVLPFRPGLVGGQGIGWNPGDIIRASGYTLPIMLAGWHINDGMGKYIAQQFIKQLTGLRIDIRFARVGLIGLSSKEDDPDIRNTKVTDIVYELRQYGIQPIIVDPLVDSRIAYEEYGIELSDLSDLHHLNAVIVAMPHQMIADMNVSDFDKLFGDGQKKLLADVKGIYDKAEFESHGYHYWSL